MIHDLPIRLCKVHSELWARRPTVPRTTWQKVMFLGDAAMVDDLLGQKPTNRLSHSSSPGEHWKHTRFKAEQNKTPLSKPNKTMLDRNPKLWIYDERMICLVVWCQVRDSNHMQDSFKELATGGGWWRNRGTEGDHETWANMFSSGHEGGLTEADVDDLFSFGP